MFPAHAFFAGLAGGLVMTGVFALGRLFGVPLSFELLLGSMTGIDPGPTAWIVGCAVHLMISGAVATVYARAFDMVAHRAGANLGAAFGLVHGAVAAVVVSIIQRFHPLSPGELAAPDPFMWNAAAGDVIVFLAAHAMYGGIVGALYERVRCGPPPVSTVSL